MTQRYVTKDEYIAACEKSIKNYKALVDAQAGTIDLLKKKISLLERMNSSQARINQILEQKQSETPEWLSEAMNSGDGTYKP